MICLTGIIVIIDVFFIVNLFVFIVVIYTQVSNGGEALRIARLCRRTSFLMTII